MSTLVGIDARESDEYENFWDPIEHVMEVVKNMSTYVVDMLSITYRL